MEKIVLCKTLKKKVAQKLYIGLEQIENIIKDRASLEMLYCCFWEVLVTACCLGVAKVVLVIFLKPTFDKNALAGNFLKKKYRERIKIFLIEYVSMKTKDSEDWQFWY